MDDDFGHLLIKWQQGIEITLGDNIHISMGKDRNGKKGIVIKAPKDIKIKWTKIEESFLDEETH